ncbi:hypothetical protein BJ322DRAFT_1058049 [Thelephora terrestris]|uniref:Aprataxin and PNK-like factor PBZ domain-containing protein n=1 Tax=Thelephora terrestris TaxID=56493 RepID=A0A9P6L7K7_9AGAM|nr:hypothetical protein BJ322DRAFT_1058049 [Thelephora terrestris]
MAPPLSSDILYCVLTSLPDFATLLSGILISKAFHQVFQAHPNSTLISVAATQIGPEVLPCAIRLAHFNRDEYLTSRAAYVRGFPSERMFTHTEASEVTPYVGALAKNDIIVRELELFFSTVCKDRASGTRSLLTPRESLRFRRAFYRWWLFVNLVTPCYLRSKEEARDTEGNEGFANADGGIDSDTDDDAYDDTDDGTDYDTEGDTEDDTEGDTDDETEGDTDNDDGADVNAQDVYIAESNDLRKGYLSEFSDDEVVEMWQVHNFMVFVSICIRNATSDPTMGDPLLLWHGPSAAAGVLRTLRTSDKPKAHFTEVLNWAFGYPDPIWPGFLEYLVLGARYDISKVKTNIWDPITGSYVFLDSRVEDSEECEECHATDLGPKLWSSSNWHLLPCAIVLNEILGHLPGTLAWNWLETQPLSTTPWSFAQFVDRHISPGTHDWSEGKVLCKECVLKLMGRHALRSLRELKAQNGPQLEDCWYGYKCRTQRKPDHAARLNHLCDPTRGE